MPRDNKFYSQEDLEDQDFSAGSSDDFDTDDEDQFGRRHFDIDDDFDGEPVGDDNIRETMVKFIGFLLGVEARLSNLHWAENSGHKHVVIDDFQSLVREFKDRISETYQGGSTAFHNGEINAASISSNDAEDLFHTVFENTKKLRSFLDGESDYTGEVSVIDDFLADVKRKIYLLRMS